MYLLKSFLISLWTQLSIFMLRCLNHINFFTHMTRQYLNCFCLNWTCFETFVIYRCESFYTKYLLLPQWSISIRIIFNFILKQSVSYSNYASDFTQPTGNAHVWRSNWWNVLNLIKVADFDQERSRQPGAFNDGQKL